jgi:hypothetical protein
MSSFDFRPTTCKCQRLIWTGLSSSGIAIKLDTAQLNLAEEIIKKLEGVSTYQIHKTALSFEATPRLGAALEARAPIVLALHICSSPGFGSAQLPDYFPRAKKESREVSF